MKMTHSSVPFLARTNASTSPMKRRRQDKKKTGYSVNSPHVLNFTTRVKFRNETEAKAFLFNCPSHDDEENLKFRVKIPSNAVNFLDTDTT